MKKTFALLSVLTLLFVWSIPGSIALRHLLMLLTTILLAGMAPGSGMRDAFRINRVPILSIALLTIWLVAQALFVSRETHWALSELKGQWVPACLALIIGAALASLANLRRLPQGTVVTTFLAAVLFSQAGIAVGHSLAWWFHHGELLRESVPLTGGKLEMSYIVNILLAVLTVDLLYRAAGYGGFLRIPGPVVLAAMLVALFCAYLAGARNGMLSALFLSLSALALFSIERHRRAGLRSALAVAVLLVGLIAVFAAVSIRSDQRWAAFGESARLGWDIDNNKAWRDTSRIPYPRLTNGHKVESSAYVRIAFIHSSLRLIGENPLGVGYGRNAFAHALRQAETAKVGHAHSGLMDLGIGGGIPAIALWVAFIASLVVTGWRRYFRHKDPHGLLLLLIATGYMGRMLLDSVNRDHMLQIFMFLVGYLLAVAPVRPRLPEAVASSNMPARP